MWESKKKKRSNWACVGVAPTGSGKTHILLQALLRANVPGRNLILVHTKDLLYQHLERIEGAYDGHFGEIGLAGDGWWQPKSDTIIAVVNSLVSNPLRIAELCRYGTIGKIVVDETHRAVCTMHQAIINGVRKKYPDVRTLGVTATYDRKDERGLREVFDETAFVIQPEYLSRNDFIARPNYIQVEDSSPHDFYAKWKRHADGERAIIFAVTQAEAKAYARYFRLMGVSAGWILDDTDKDEADRIKEECTILTNCSTMTEGSDIDGVRVAMIQRVSDNVLNYTQKAGRAMRVKRDWRSNRLKTDAFVIAERHHDLLSPIPKDVLGKVKLAHEVEESIPPPREKPVWYLRGMQKGYW